MAESPSAKSSTDPDAIVEEYLRRIDSGEQIDREAYIAAHPDVAPALKSFFANEQLMRQWTAGSVAPAAKDTAPKDGSPTIAPKSVPASALTGPTGAIVFPAMMGRYRLERELGRGAMGNVYLAHDTDLDRPVALKIPKFTAADNQELIARFLREARAAAVLAHPNICRVYDVNEHQGVRYIAMEFIEGKPLSAFIAGGNVQAKQAASVIRKLALGLAEAHQRNILHRDLKPDNILVNKQGEPVLTDFGLARETTAGKASATQDGVILGSPAYMPPEQAAGNLSEMGPTSDIYSLGVVLYEMLTGEVPFRGSVVEVLASVLMKTPKTVREQKPDIDPGIAAICDKMMAKKASDRYPTMMAVAQALGDWLRTGGQQAAAASSKLPEPLSNSGEFKIADPKSKLAAGPHVVEPKKIPGVNDKPKQTIAPGTAKQTISPTATKTPERTEKQINELAELGDQLLARNDYLEAIRLAEEIPDYQRTPALRRMLGESYELKGKVEKLERNLEKYLNTLDLPELKKTVTALLKIHPGHPRGKEIKKALNTGGKKAVVQILKDEGNYDAVGNVWEPKVLAGGIAGILALAVIAYFAVTIYIKGQMQTVVITLDDPTADVKVDNQTVIIKGQQTGEIKLTLGKHEYTVEKDGIAVKNPQSFTVTKDGSNKVEITLKEPEKKPEPPVGNNRPSSTQTASGPAPDFTWELAKSRQAKLTNIKNKAESLNAEGFNGMFTEIPPRYVESPAKIYIGEDNIASFDVAEDGFVVLTCNYDYQGNDSGGWLEKRWTAEQFAENGWKQLSDAEVGGRLYAAPHKRYQTFFVKWLKKGEKISLSCNKSDPPYLIQFETSGGASGSAAPAVAPFNAVQAKDYQEAWAKHLGVPVEYTNSVGMTFRLIPPGEYLQGSTPEQIKEWSDFYPKDNQDAQNQARAEGPQHKVVLTKPFYLGVYEVTQKQYEQVMGDNPVKFNAAAVGKDTSNFPVDSMSWASATAFCDKLNAGQPASARYRLPTEAEWEFACRGGTTTRYWFGDNADKISEFENFGGAPQDVGILLANPFGLFDMNGNVREWTDDWWSLDEFQKFANQPAVDPVGAKDGNWRVVRGGSWGVNPGMQAQASLRLYDRPGGANAGYGFRVVLPVDAVPKVLGQNPLFLNQIQETSVDFWEYQAKWGFNKHGHIGEYDARDEARKIVLGGKPSPHGIFCHAKPNGSSSLKYDIGPLGYESFSTTAGIADYRQSGPSTPHTFEVYGDGQLLWKSEPVPKWGVPQECSNLNVKGVKELELRVVCPGDAGWGIAVWCEPRLHNGGGKAASSTPSASLYPPLPRETFLGNFTVEKAAYFDAKNNVDLTQRFQQRLEKDGFLAAFVERTLSGNQFDGLLQLRLKTADGTYESILKHHDAVFFDRRPRPQIPTEGVVLLDAFYGTGLFGEGNLVDAKDSLAKQLTQNRLDVELKAAVTALGDPAPNRVKGAIIRYAVDGKVKLTVVGEQSVAKLGYLSDEDAKEKRELAEAAQAAATLPAGSPPLAVFPLDEYETRELQEAWAGHLGVPVEITNSIGMKLRLMPPGAYWMGSTPEEIGRFVKLAKQEKAGDKAWPGFIQSEKPRHRVVLSKPFYMGMLEVTEQQYQRLMGRIPSQSRHTSSAETAPMEFPVDAVTWNEATEFCKKLSDLEQPDGREYRLPTEAEFEYGCRGGSTAVWHSGDDMALRDYAVVGANSGGKMHPAGWMKPNGFGLHDMAGNAWEWVADRYSPKGYEDKNPKEPDVDPIGVTSGNLRVYRGGSFEGISPYARSASRIGLDPAKVEQSLGFRVVLPISAAKRETAAK